jgi:dsDNA-specific endonuclease/ATPase MutS2
MLWFDQVLADIGDAQSLQQNLSTFSGHIRRIKAILAAATGRSLVLLDEVRRADRVILLLNGR